MRGPGTLVVVSHDRAFLERTVEDVVVLDGEGAPPRSGRVPGGYAAYEAMPGPLAGERPAVGPATASAGAAVARKAPTAGAGRRRPLAGTLRHLMRQAEAEVRRLHERHRARGRPGARQGDHAALARSAPTCGGRRRAGRGRGVWLALAEEAEAQGLLD